MSVKNPLELTNYDQIAQLYIEHTEAEDSWNNLYERPAMIEMFADFSRVLNPGGRVYISTHDPLADFLVLDKKSYFASLQRR